MIVAQPSPLTSLAASVSTCACRTQSLRQPFPSPTSSRRPALTLADSISSGLFALAKKANPFVIRQIQPLFPKHPGWGAPNKLPFRISNLQTLFPRQLQIVATGSSGFYFPSAPPAAVDFARRLFSYSYELPFPQALSFHNHPNCPGVAPPSDHDGDEAQR